MYIKNVNFKWVLIVIILSFILSIIFSYISTIILFNISNITIAIFVLLFFIFIGILFDIIGVAATSCNNQKLNSMASKKISGAKEALWIIANAEKISSICNDVIGDIAGIISGTTSVIIINNIEYQNNLQYQFSRIFIAGIIASLTIGGKALGKNIAIKKNMNILFLVGKIIYFYNKYILKYDRRLFLSKKNI